MSNIQYVFLKKSDVPSRSQLQASIDALGFDMQLDPELDLLEDEGFSPNVLEGRAEVGLDLGRETTAEVMEYAEDLREVVGERDLCITMAWHGSMADCACALVVGCALATDFGAVVSYGCEPPDALPALLEEARAAVAEARDEA